MLSVFASVSPGFLVTSDGTAFMALFLCSYPAVTSFQSLLFWEAFFCWQLALSYKLLLFSKTFINHGDEINKRHFAKSASLDLSRQTNTTSLLPAALHVLGGYFISLVENLNKPRRFLPAL